MIEENFNGTELKFVTDKELFSPEWLDKGTKAMLSIAEIPSGSKVLDLGCGYGFVGIYILKAFKDCEAVMSDIKDNALRLSEENARLNGVSPKIIKSSGFESIEDNEFDIILSNPPYHADFSVPKHFIEEGYKRLKTGGMLYMVTKRLDWYKNKITSVFGGVKVYEKDGYYIFCAKKYEHKRKNMQAKKNESSGKNKLSKKLARKYNKA